MVKPFAGLLEPFLVSELYPNFLGYEDQKLIKSFEILKYALNWKISHRHFATNGEKTTLKTNSNFA